MIFEVITDMTYNKIECDNIIHVKLTGITLFIKDDKIIAVAPANSIIVKLKN